MQHAPNGILLHAGFLSWKAESVWTWRAGCARGGKKGSQCVMGRAGIDVGVDVAGGRALGERRPGCVVPESVDRVLFWR